MKKLAHLILPVLVAIGTNMHAAEQEEGRIERTKRWIKEKASQAAQYMPEDKTIAKGIQYGTMAAGTAAGYVAGMITAKKIAQYLGYAPKIAEIKGATEKQKKGVELAATYGPHVAAAVTSYAVSDLMQRLGKQGAILYLVKRRNVTKEIALASLIANVSINDEIKQLFQAAQDGNSEFLKGFLTAYYEKLFGDNWYQIVTSPKLDFLPLGAALKSSSKRVNTAGLPYVTALLYWNKEMKDAGPNTKLKVAQKLLNELFGNTSQ